MPVKIALLVSLLLTISQSTLAASAAVRELELTPLTDLQADAVVSREQQRPILIAFTASYCHYCEIVKEQFLKPMLRNEKERNKVLIREASLDSYGSVRDFSGRSIGLDDLALRYRAFLTPTVIILGPDGTEIGERLRGVTTVDYYGGYLDDAIDTARQRLGAVRAPDSLPGS